MEIAEIRDLDGPNLFMLRPAIKLEIDTGETPPLVARQFVAAFLERGDVTGPDHPELLAVPDEELVTLLEQVIAALHRLAGVEPPRTTSRRMESPGHLVVAFSWAHRALGRLVARTAFDLVSGATGKLTPNLTQLREWAAGGLPDDSGPEMLADDRRTLPIIAVTGTNGKTTTTRMIASILMGTGRKVGWTSSSGVVIQGEMVLEGDYTGPAGAKRVYEEPGLDIAVLETARGGILLRGLGYESSDVSVATNVSADHLGLHGVYTVEELAHVKAVVPAVTRAEGFAVLNADDPLVLAMRDTVRARVFLVSRDPANPAVREHRASGGWALWAGDGVVRFAHDGVEEELVAIEAIPIAFGGRAPHMLENALCAAAACLGYGLATDQVREGLTRFRNEAKQNRGRLNVYDVGGVTVVVDFAHNVEGLRHLLNLGRGFAGPAGRIIAVVGTAGDRPDATFLELGRLAGTQADAVIIKDTTRYLRGRSPGESAALIRKGLDGAGHATCDIAHSEFEALERGLAQAKAGDSLVIMCVEEVDRILAHLETIGQPVS